LCRAALAAGIDLRGAQLTVSGEPCTAARLAVIRETGAEAVPRYGASELGTFAYGCLAPERPDDLHLFDDLHAVIQPGPTGQQALPSDSLLISSLHPTARTILLNASLGDRAEMKQRDCGCALAVVGWTTHVHTVRSYEKLTAGGITFLDTDIIRVLEEMLPQRFGGGPTDYQRVEEQDEHGRPSLRLIVHPSVGPIDAESVADAFLSAIGGGSGIERLTELHWRQAGLLRVERDVPRVTPAGKVLHLHQPR
jgi:hypothetical protein